MSTDPDVMAIVKLLARYLRDNPNACDTPDGIGRWWLDPSVVPASATLEAALDSLERRDLIERLRAADGRVRYRRRDLEPKADAALDTLAQGVSDDAPGTAH